MELKIFTDGGARGNPGPAACAFVAVDNHGELVFKEGEYLGIATNNVAEYKAVVLALQWVKNKKGEKIFKIEFYLDSNLVVNQLNGLFKVREGSLQELFSIIKKLESEIECAISYTHVRREKNVEADKLVNETLDSER